MKVHQTALPGVVLLEPQVHVDERGFFIECFNTRTFAGLTGSSASFVQDNHSHSVRGVLRGLHYQVRHTQGKLVRVTRGVVFDVAVDLRRSSPTFGRWDAHELSEHNHLQVWIPPGFAHGLLVLSDEVDVLYNTTDFHAPGDERSICWDDPDLAIPWPLERAGVKVPLLSTRDRGAVPFAQADVFD